MRQAWAVESLVTRRGQGARVHELVDLIELDPSSDSDSVVAAVQDGIRTVITC